MKPKPGRNRGQNEEAMVEAEVAPGGREGGGRWEGWSWSCEGAVGSGGQKPFVRSEEPQLREDEAREKEDRRRGVGPPEAGARPRRSFRARERAAAAAVMDGASRRVMSDEGADKPRRRAPVGSKQKNP